MEIDLPEVDEPSAAFSAYWIRLYFRGSLSQNTEVNALANTYMRLVEAAILDYVAAGAALRKFWNTHTGTDLRSMNRSVSYFESCVSSMQRAIRAHRALRRHKSQDPISVYLASDSPAFAKDAVADQSRLIRDEVHHTEERLVKGRYLDGQNVALRPNGPEVPHPSEEGQTILRINRLEIGGRQLSFESIATWLREMSATAEKLAAYSPSQSRGVVQ